MATPPSFVLLLVSAIILSCNGATHLPRTKRTVELVEGAKDFILRMAEINATPGRLVWVQVNDENYKGYGAEEVEREPFTLKPRKEKEEATTTEKQSITITEVQTEKLFLPESPTPPPPPPPITDFYPPSKPSNYDEKSTTEAPAPKEPVAPQDKKKGLLTSLFSLIFPSKPKTKKKEEKKTETTTETVTVFIPDETTTTTERHYLPPPTEAAPPPKVVATTPRPTTTPTTTTTTTVPPIPVHVHHIIQPVHIPIPQPVHVQHPVHVQQPVHIHKPVHIQQPVHVQQPVHLPVSHHVPQSQIQLIGLQQFSLPVCTSSPVSSFQRCLPPASASLPLTQSSIGHVPLNAGFVRLPRNINQLQQQHLTLVDYTDSAEDQEDYSDLVADMDYFY